MKRVYRDKPFFVRLTIPGHALPEKGLQRQNGVGPLVSSEEQRPLLVPRFNRLLIGCQPLVWFLYRFTQSLVRASGETFRRRVFDALEDTSDASLLSELFCRRPALPSPTSLPRRSPRTDPPVVCPGFELERFVQDSCARCLGGYEGHMSPRRTDSSTTTGLMATFDRIFGRVRFKPSV